MTTTKIFVGSLPPGTKPEELRHLFEDYGVVVECDVMNRCGFVHMETKEMANTAIAALNASEFKGQMIVVELGRPKDRKPGVGNAINRGGRGGRGSNMGVRGGRGSGSSARGGGGRGGGGPGNRAGGPGGRDGGMLRTGGVGQNFGNSGRGAPKNKFGSGGGGGGGPMRNESFKQQRNLPYERRTAQDGNSGGPFSGGAGGRFSGNQRQNFNNGIVGAPRGSGRFGGDVGQQNFHNFDVQPVADNGHYGGNFNDNESFVGSFGSNMGGNMAGGFGGNKATAGQDRRGFALSTAARGGGQRFSAGNRGGFGGGSMQTNTGLHNNSEENLFSRRNVNGPDVSSNNGAPPDGMRGGFGNGRGNGPSGVGGRGAFRRGRGMGSSEGFSPQNSYNNNFPPLGIQSGGGVRGGRGGRGGAMQRNGPRQNMMPNQRF